MSANRYPYLFATLGDAARQLPDDIARPLETTLAANPAANGITLLACLQRIREVDAADGQPLQRKGRAPGQCTALARINRANAGLTVLLELLHASERVRVDGDEAQQVGNDVREGLLLACRGLSEYVDTQVYAA
ncbi:hypothetical protein CCR98_11305 [Stenotrophomonas sp. WZN-1]|uniref:hypothetical protein n=1 Tax=Stenotrophomonas TaxID=40323 RepID=UPI000B42D4E9|nr:MULTISPECIES: hypothetical protein [Stenotrophomonas]ARZ74737.1 hypothetical protein CCR98_11305 [Stenotrophomonas sp. WZN-1]MCU0999525.1 hypothetical protein [Stenotrophomonas maltophilia]MCU1067882.1 hypothetical protein [Stenotrophomonas maltophilia]MCU1074745.1 hypothetical protein [Stenotrophomonas maltophilia]MCU1139959.1 hypothetical protein [Stenotrophomonas maltophilia]